MYAQGVGNGNAVQFATGQNSQIVMNPDPDNPVIAQPEDSTNGQQFMTLMIEQLKNQDPMNPLDSAEFTSQLATINSLEQLISINQLLEQSINAGQISEATALIDKYVEGIDANGDFITGYVEQVELLDGVPTLKVGDKLLLVDQLMMVSNHPTVATGGDGS